MRNNKNRDKILAELRINPDSTIRELAEAAGISSFAVVHHHLAALMMLGFIRKNPRWAVVNK